MTVHLGFYAAADTTVNLHDYGTERTPILSLGNIAEHLTISALDSIPLTDHLTFARHLAAAAADYLAALEMYAAQSAPIKPRRRNRRRRPRAAAKTTA
ncbi:hypothetical protein ABH931_005497 [Streptacidiphilus sp. MAP12-33]|uniref:hypothetical protein n=1 Tax=Streptacidiphilus sp. MAP12-33 TaxID=3156266 RepID=UPI00351593A6